MSDWKDETSWSKSDKDRSEPRTMALRTESLRISVHRHRDYPGEWLLSCYPGGAERIRLKSKELKEAQAEGLEFLHNYFSALTKQVADAAGCTACWGAGEMGGAICAHCEE